MCVCVCVCVCVCALLSAGVGRTGVFITLSIVLERMRYEGVVDLFQTVKTLRTQRPAMVQTEVRTVKTQYHTVVRRCFIGNNVDFYSAKIDVQGPFLMY